MFKMKKIQYNFENNDIRLNKLQDDYSKSFDDIGKKAKVLAAAIKDSPEYQDYIAAKERLDSDAANVRVLRELREQQFNFQFAPPDDDLEKKARFLNEMYMAVSLNPVISDYLNAEYRFGLIVDELKKNFESVFTFEENLGLGVVAKAEYLN